MKMTLKEFWESKEKLAINCKTEGQAKIFRIESHKLGKKRSDGDSFLDLNDWDCYEEISCYDNEGDYGDLIWYELEGYIILKFEDIDWNYGLKISKQEELYAKYGKDLQINIVIEEMAELTKELLKDKRGKDNRPQIVEELADVLFTLEYVKIAFNIKQEEIDKVLKDKGLM